MGRITLLTVRVLVVAVAATAPEECQPKGGIHQHQPQYHIIAPMFPGENNATWPGGVNDANGIFRRDGVWHVFHQCDGGPAGAPCGGGWEGPNPHPNPAEAQWFHSWGHVVSTDLVHWRRLPDALSPNLTNYEHGEACDGSVSFPPGVGPVLMYGPGCDHAAEDAPGDAARHSSGLSSRHRPLDTAVIGLAFPENASDPFLTNWSRSDKNPVRFAPDSLPCSFAGRVWQTNSSVTGDSGWNLVCASGGQWARYTAPVLTGPWTIANRAFAGRVGGSSGPAFFPLTNPTVGGPTHLISDGSGSRYSVGTTTAGDAAFQITASFTTDLGGLKWTAAGVDDATGRILLVGWVVAGNDPSASKWCPKIKGIAVCGVQVISSVRVLTYTPPYGLTAYPPIEAATLHNGTLVSEANVTLAPGQRHTLPIPAGSGAAMDLVVNLMLPAVGTRFAVGTFVSEAGVGTGYQLTVSVPAASAHPRTVVIGNGSGYGGGRFDLLEGEASLEVRVLVDRSITEFFVGGGRATITDRSYPPVGSNRAYVESSTTAVASSIQAFDMGCGWVAGTRV